MGESGGTRSSDGCGRWQSKRVGAAKGGVAAVKVVMSVMSLTSGLLIEKLWQMVGKGRG